MAITTIYENINEISESSFADRVNLILEQQKRSKAWLATEIGISKQALNYLLSYSTKKKMVVEIAEALQVNPDWLKTGEGGITLNFNQRDDINNIPLLTIPEFSANKVAQKTLIISNDYPKDCFAVTLNSNSMEPLFSEGTALIFDPNKKPQNGNFVLFSLKGNEVLFRQFFKEGKDVYFRAHNQMFKNIKTAAYKIQGTLLESRAIFN